VITLGIDLAAQPIRTAACAITWKRGAAQVLNLENRLDDDALLEMIAGADKTGIDAPFGWPEAFVTRISQHNRQGSWPSDRDQNALRGRLAYRETDRFVADRGTRPLSVATDKIAVPAMRCAHLLDQLRRKAQPVDRAGSGKVVEVYPSPALVAWGFAGRGYKRLAGQATLKLLMRQLLAEAPWLEIGAEERRLCERNDDAFDAVICSLVARAAHQRRTHQPPAAVAEQARREGWIHVPRDGSFELLPGRTR
jgi:predicted nuclease with RNAse H fold